MPSSIPPGSFVLHSHAIPDLSAGSYAVHATQSFTAPGATTTALDRHIVVTGPRYTLPPDQILSTFPPNKAEGSFSSRLPQIVLKRRSLPWERELEGTFGAAKPPRATPWLALVLLADGEADFLSARPIAECVTDDVVLDGPGDTAIGDAIVVTKTVVDKVFPTQDDLPLLAHVREVDLSDTELAMGDDDGCLAVVLCNRLPQSGVRYRACLVSLEGQYGRLAATADVEPDPPQAFVSPYVYPVSTLTFEPLAPVAANGAISISDAWSMERSRPRERLMERRQKSTARFQTAASAAHVGEMHAVGTLDAQGINEPRYTFPVLANWQFTCTGDVDFQALMQRLDVGLLDTVVQTTVQKGARKPPPPRTRPQPQVIDTGHAVLEHTSRAGEPESVWYRGPLVPHPGGRDAPNAKGVLPLLHSSDQARRIGPDGRENLSLAAAFEIGRLLALAEPRVVAAFLNWRKEGLDGARRIEFASTDLQLKRVDLGIGRFAARMGITMLVDLGRNVASRLGNPIPLVERGCPIDGIDGTDLVELIAVGFGLPADTVRGLIDVGATGSVAITPPVGGLTGDLAGLAANTTGNVGHLRDAARGLVDAMARDALAGQGVGGGTAHPDALDGVLAGRKL